MKLKSRRAFLKGAGSVSIGLPLTAFGANFLAPQRVYGLEQAATLPRLVTFSFPNGCEGDFWKYDSILAPLKEMASKIIVLNGIRNPISEQSSLDAHQQGGAALFTGVRLKDEQTNTGISIDQWLSQRINNSTPMQRSLVMGVWRGFAGATFRSPSWYHRSWMSNGDPAAALIRPRDIFTAIFGELNSDEVARKEFIKRRRSVLDTVIEQMKSLQSDRSNLSSMHKAYLSNHLEKVRSLELKSIELESRLNPVSCKPLGYDPADIKLGKDGLLSYSDFEQVFLLQIDLLVMALQCDATRTGSLMFGSAGEEYFNPTISKNQTDHGSSHYANAEQFEAYLAFRRFHMQNFRYLMNKLDEAKLLDTTTLLMGSEFGDGRTHAVHPMPHIIAGGGGQLQMGQILDLPQHTLCDVYATVLTGLGFPVGTFGEVPFNTGLIKGMLKQS